MKLKAIFEFENKDGQTAYTFKHGEWDQLEQAFICQAGLREGRILPEGSREFDEVVSRYKEARGEEPEFTRVAERILSDKPTRSRSGGGLER